MVFAKASPIYLEARGKTASSRSRLRDRLTILSRVRQRAVILDFCHSLLRRGPAADYTARPLS
jgi:hypothetical protein